MSNRLPVLQADIQQAIESAHRAASVAAQHILDAGKALIEAKSLCGHGQWLPFLKVAGIHERTAQRYMKLAASNLKSDTMSELGGVNPSLRFLKLRETALHHMEHAQAAAQSIEDGEEADVLTPLTWARCIADEMIRMFPNHEDWTGSAKA